MAHAWDRAMESGTFALSLPVVAHFTCGGLILGLMFWRLALRQERGAPPPHPAEPLALSRMARTVHLAFYVVLIALPLTGGLAWGTESEALGLTHEVLRALLALLILAHVIGALYHRVVLKTDVLTRMTRPAD